jgi:hypothetical protein
LSAPVGLEIFSSEDGVCDAITLGHGSVSGVDFDCSETDVNKVSVPNDNVLDTPNSDNADNSEGSTEITREFLVLDLQKQTAANNMNNMLRNASNAASV